jgi:RND family efflux transporter MFP subunit
MLNAEKAEQPKGGDAHPPAPKVKRWLIGFALVATALAAAGVVSRSLKAARLDEWTQKQAIPTVEAISPKTGSGQQDLALPGDIQALFNAQIRARVNGYIKDWRHDIGARVKAGEVLAAIDAPELDQQLEQAKGEQAKALAQEQLAKLTSKRWAALRASTAVSQQSADEKSGDVEAKSAELSAAKSNVERLKALESFKLIVAPFTGVVTARKIDIGVLVGPGNDQELFDVSDLHQVYIYVRAPQAYAAQLREGMITKLKVPQFKDRWFAARLISTSSAIAEKSRTLLVQLIADNPNYELLPGSYAEVHFQLPGNQESLRLPASAIFYRDNEMNVATIGADNKVAIKKIEIARDLGVEIEISSGISAADRVINNPPERLADGDVVKLSSEENAQGVPGAQKAGIK